MQNSKHSSNISAKSTRARIRALEEIPVILQSEEVSFHPLDGKAKVPIGMTAAKKQTCLLMIVEYHVTLPDHDHVAGSKHKLIFSVIRDMKVVKRKDISNDAVNYSGPTNIPIRSTKYSGSSAFHHLHAMNRVYSLPEFINSF